MSQLSQYFLIRNLGYTCKFFVGPRTLGLTNEFFVENRKMTIYIDLTMETLNRRNSNLTSNQETTLFNNLEPEPITFFLVGYWLLAGNFGFRRSLCTNICFIKYSQPRYLWIESKLYLLCSALKVFKLMLTWELIKISSSL